MALPGKTVQQNMPGMGTRAGYLEDQSVLHPHLIAVATRCRRTGLDRESTNLKNLDIQGECFICGLEATIGLQGFYWCKEHAAKQLSETFKHLVGVYGRI
jgi:hypothetical protein